MASIIDMPQQIDYHKLDYDHKLLYMRSVFEEAQSSSPVYKKLYDLLSGSWKIQEHYLDELYKQVEVVLTTLHNKQTIAKMGKLALKIARIKELEEQDRQNELSELGKLEQQLMRIEDDKPISSGI